MRVWLTAYFSLLLALFAVSISAAVDVHPVVSNENSCEGLLLGGTIDGRWMNAGRIAPHLKGNEHYKLYSRNAYIGTSAGSKPRKEDSHCLIRFPKGINKYEIGIAGNWNPAPRKPLNVKTNQKIYLDAVRKVLDSKGLKSSKVNIETAVKVDLEGDGQDEVLIAAESKNYDPVKYVRGQYSLVLLRKIVGGKVRNILICGDFHRKSGTWGFPEKYKLSGMWDIDGDGELEIAVIWSNQRADVAGLALYDLKKGKPVLLAKDGIGN